MWAHPGTVDIHLLEPVSTAGTDYNHREVLMAKVQTRMEEAMRELYGVEPLPPPPSRASVAVESVSETEPTETR